MKTTRSRAKKRFGQHFLERAWVDKLIAAVAPAPTDRFLEIGPGRGALTFALAPRVARIVAVEIDRELVAAVTSDVPAHVRVVCGDFLTVDLDEVLRDLPRPVRVVGNLAYNVASPILFRLLHTAENGRRFSDATVMLQKEVADRLCASVGDPGYGALAIQVGLTADAARVLTLPPGAFRPPPKVTSTAVRLRFREPIADVGDPRVFERVVRGLFLHRRKTLLRALTPVTDALGRDAAQVLVRAGLDSRCRPETLTIHDMARLSRAVL